MQARVIVVAGPSGSGKSRLCSRLGLPFVNLDDFYKNGSDPTLPYLDMGVADWDDPASWLHDEAVDALETLCRHGAADIPVYDIARDGRVGHRVLDLDGSPYVVAEGIFAQELVAECRARGLVADAICVRHHPALTFWRRFSRDLRERRKPPLVLLRRGLMLMRQEPQIVGHAVALGCTPMTSDVAYHHVSSMVAGDLLP